MAERPSNRIDSLIGAGITIEGNVLVSGALRIDGTVKGNVVPFGTEPVTLVLGDQGVVEGRVHAAYAIINGRVVGQICVTESVELQSKCRVDGDVYFARLEMRSGAVVNGRLQGGASKLGQERQAEPRLAAVS
jgi:cytoskeletal protein CcmA (bactofilin family)